MIVCRGDQDLIIFPIQLWSGCWRLGLDARCQEAWATKSHISLGQVVVDDKSNEITAIPNLPEILETSGSLVTIDALSCQVAIVQAILLGK